MGGKRLPAVLCALLLLVLAACGNEPGGEDITGDDTNTLREAPIAAFTISPAAGYPGTEFTLDASATFDWQELTSHLDFRWDYENDGVWDTNFDSSNMEVTTSVYKTEGTYSIRMQVRDSDGNTDSIVEQLEVLPSDAPHLSGTIEFEKIPVTSQGLDFNNPQHLPARRVLVRSYRASDDVALGEDFTDESGAYSVTALAGEQVYVKTFAKTVDKDAVGNVIGKFAVFPPGSSFPLTDEYVYSAASSIIQMGSSDKTANFLIPDRPNRASGPFNIIDVIERAYDMVRTVNPDTPLKDLMVRWSRDYYGGTYYTGDENALYINGNRNTDSDEFDDMIVAHEFAHFMENNLYRTDTIGGPHYLGEPLDVRVAWSEGYATAFAGMALGTPLYRDSCNDPGGLCIDFNIENNSSVPAPKGYYNEASVFAILWDLYDDDYVIESWDSIPYGFEPAGSIWGDSAYKSDTDLIYLYPFIDRLIAERDNEPATSAILAEENVPYPEPFENTIVDLGNPPNSVVGVLIDGGLGNDDSDYEPWDYNTYGANKFFRFRTSADTTIRIETNPNSLCDSDHKDVDLFVYRKGKQRAVSNGSTCKEVIEGPVAGGVPYIINVRAWDAGQYKFDLSVTTIP